MKIAITGGSGGVGRATVAAALARGHTVVSIDRVAPVEAAAVTGFAFHQAAMTDYDALLAAFEGCDGLIHLAAIPVPSRCRTMWFTATTWSAATMRCAPPSNATSRAFARRRA